MKANAYLTLSQLHMMEYFVKEVKTFRCKILPLKSFFKMFNKVLITSLERTLDILRQNS